MTRNNLNEHLSWLLANINLSTPNAPTLPPLRDPISSTASSPTDETVFFTPTAGLSPATRSNDPATTQLYPVLPTEPSHPSTSAANGAALSKIRSREDRREGEEIAGKMGRLASRPDVKRPNLLLRQEQLLSPASTTASTIGASLSNDYPAFLAKNAAQKRTAARNGFSETRPESVFLTPGATLSTTHTMDTIGLTNGSGQTSPISTIFGSDIRVWCEDFASRPGPVIPSENSVAFGSDKVIWHEDYASRPSPLPTEENSVIFGSNAMVWEEETAGRPEPQSSKRGKKRKSDQISQRPTTTTTDDFPDIMDLLTDDESLRTPVKQSPTKSPARSKLKTSPNKSPSKGTAVTKTPSKQRINLAYDDTSINPSRIKVSPFKTPKRGSTLGKSEFSDSKLASLLSDSDSLFGSDVERVPKCEAKTPRRRGKDERVIQDSDDEILTPSAYKVTESAIPRSGSPSKRYHNSQHQHHNSAQGTPSRTRGLISSQTVTVVRSPQKRERRKLSESEPVKSPDEARADNPASSQTDVHHSDEKMSAMLRLFLCRPSIMEMKRISLEEGLRQNRESFKKSLQEGSFEPREHLRRDKERLIKQQAALDVLSNEYRSYEDLVAKRDALIARIYDAYGHDLNTEDDETHLQGLDILLKARQDSLKTHLLNAGIKDPTEYEDQTVHNLNTNRSESIVQATQATQPIARSNWLRESTQVSGMGSAQVIMQTQVPARPDTQRQTIYSSLDRGEQCSVAVRGNEPVTSIPHPAADMMDYEGDDLFETPDFLPSRDLSKTTRVVHQSSAAKCRRSPRKATALQKRGYESDYSDDIDISELAQEIEFQRSSSELRPAKPTRSVLLETSGNVGTRREKPAAKVKQNSTAVPVSPRQKKFPWYKDVRRALKDRFRMSGFRHNQLAAINATLSGKDAFILMPTGGGKSLCYQLPAVVNSGKTKGITVVVSPLLSLMHDQVEHLKALNIAAAAFNGETPPREKKEIMDTLMDPKSDQILRLLYVTPEMINKSTTFLNGLSSLYRNKKLARLVIDEAHCVSQWGHDFRPDYKQLGSFRERFPGVPLMALTATATQNVITDVKHNLGVEECEQFTQSFNRPNLYYEVCRKEKDNTATIADLINSKYPGKTGIVYTLSRKSAENIAQKLRDQGIAAHHYHASVDSKEKVRIQRDWQRGAIKVVVATIAFGMGIDKSDVRFVIHQSVPKSLEGYYQETGRAGRDGKPSECYLYFSYGDVTQLRKLIADGDGNEEQKERQRNMLGTVTAFCDNQSDCRRVEILRYFGETFSKAQCNATCDNCKSEDQFEQKDFTKYALAVLEIVGSEGRVTLAQCTDYLMAKKKKSDYSYVVQKYHGIARSMPKHEVHRVVDRLLAEEALTEENVWMSTIRMTIQYFRTGRTARSFLDDGRRLWLTTRVKSDGSQVGAPKTQRRLDTPAAPATRRVNTAHLSSTCVSSPAPKTASKKKGKAVASHDEDRDEDVGISSNGYTRDGFVVDDDEHSEDDFEPVPPLARRRQMDSIGPPISRDARLSDESLTEVQKDILESFFKEAQILEEKVRVSRTHRQPIFSQLQLREMGLRWTVTLDQMRRIPGIDRDAVDRHGDRLLPLIQRYHQRYQEIMGVLPEPRAMPSLGEIVDLVSTDDEEEDDDMEGIEDYDDVDDDDEEGRETSGYFGPPVGERKFMDKMKTIQRTDPQDQQGAASKSGGRASGSGTRTRGKSNWRGGRKQHAPRRSSGSKFAGVKKKGVAAKRTTSSQGARGARAASQSRTAAPRGKGGRLEASGFEGIGLMDH